MRKIQYTCEAHDQMASLSPERQERLRKGIAVIQEDPYHRLSVAMNAEGTLRKIQATSRILVEYVVIDNLTLVVVLELFDDLEVLVEEA